MEKKWYEIKAASEDEAEVWIYAEIGEDLWGDGSSVAARTFAEELAATKAAKIALHLNSPGGSAFDGQAIYTTLKNHPASVTTYIDGLAASIASVVALAGDRVVMAENALYMIHDPHGSTYGTAAEMRKYATILEKTSESMRTVYRAKTGMADEEIAAAMADETWYTAEEALAAGFVDEVSEHIAAAAIAEFDPKALGFKRVPEQLLKHDDPKREEELPPAAESAPAEEPGDTSPTLSKRAIYLLTQTRHGGLR